LINLTSIGDWQFDPDAILYMKDTPTAITQLKESVFYTTLHRRYQLMDTAKISVDSDLNMFYEDELDEREYYHLHVSLMTDLVALSIDAIDRFCKHGKFAIKLMMRLDPTLALCIPPDPLPEGWYLKPVLRLHLPVPDRRVFIPDQSWLDKYGADNIVIVMPDPIPSGVIYNDDGSALLPNGDVYIPPYLLYTSVVLEDGSVLYCDGRIKYPDNKWGNIVVLPKLLPDGTISRIEFNKAAKKISDKRGLDRDPRYYNSYIVGNMIVQVNRR